MSAQSTHAGSLADNLGASKVQKNSGPSASPSVTKTTVPIQIKNGTTPIVPVTITAVKTAERKIPVVCATGESVSCVKKGGDCTTRAMAA
jgi:hypothetical protein